MVFFCWKRIALPYRILCVLVLLTLAMEGLGYFLLLKGINNMPLFHFYTYVEAILIAIYYYFVYHGRRIRWVYPGLLALFLIFSFINVLFNEQLTHFNSLQRSVECIWVLMLALLFFVDLFNRSEVPDLIRYPHYWMTSGFLLYFAGTLFFSMVGDIYLSSDKVGFNVFDIHSGLNIFLNLMYTTVVWMASGRSGKFLGKFFVYFGIAFIWMFLTFIFIEYLVWGTKK